MNVDDALDVIDGLLDSARDEVKRLERRVSINAEQHARESSTLPGAYISTAVEDQIALLVAQGQVTALLAAWAAVARKQRSLAPTL